MSEEPFRELTLVLQEVFAYPSMEIDRNTTINDIPGWDSFSHVVFMLTANKRFKVRLPATIEFGNFGELSDKISELIGNA